MSLFNDHEAQKFASFLPRFPQADPTGQVIGLNLPQQHVVRLFQVETYHPPDIYIYIYCIHEDKVWVEMSML